MWKHWMSHTWSGIIKFVMQDILYCVYLTYTSYLSIYFFIGSASNILRFSWIMYIGAFLFWAFLISEIELTKFSHSKSGFQLVIIYFTTVYTENSKTCFCWTWVSYMNSKWIQLVFLRFFFLNEYLSYITILT